MQLISPNMQLRHPSRAGLQAPKPRPRAASPSPKRRTPLDARPSPVRDNLKTITDTLIWHLCCTGMPFLSVSNAFEPSFTTPIQVYRWRSYGIFRVKQFWWTRGVVKDSGSTMCLRLGYARGASYLHIPCAHTTLSYRLAPSDFS